MYTTLEPATGGTVPSYTNLQLAPPSPSKYYPGVSTPSAYPPYQYPAPHYTRPGYSGAPSQELLSTLYPGYTGQFSYDSLGSIGQSHSSVYDTSGKSGYGGIYVPSAALPSKTTIL